MRNFKKRFDDDDEIGEWKWTKEIAEGKSCVPDGNSHCNVYELWCRAFKLDLGCHHDVWQLPRAKNS
jgi:hypothetical protein